MTSRLTSKEQLLELEERIEGLRSSSPEARSLWLRLVGPMCRFFGYLPRFTNERISLLINEVRACRGKDAGTSVGTTPSELVSLFEAAVVELKRNVEVAELGSPRCGGLAPSYGVCLRNMVTVLIRLWPLVDDSKDSWENRVAEVVSFHHIAPPLLPAETKVGTEGETGSVRLSSIDVLIESARAETQFLERRRRLLEAARETLIDANASLVLDVEAVNARHGMIANELLEVGRIEAAGISPRIRISRQLREAHQRGEWSRLHAGLVGLEQLSLDGKEQGVGEAAHRGLSAVWGRRNRFDRALARESSMQSVDEQFGRDIKVRLESGIGVAKRDYRGPTASEKVEGLSPWILDTAMRHVLDLDVSLYLNGLLAVDGCFDVGGVLVPTRVLEESRRSAAVRYPTAELALLPAEGPEDIPDCVVGDPRTIIPDLAAGRLLARRFVGEERQKTRRTVLLGELRIYLLDGSTSMLTYRSVLRDAILIAELCTVIARLSDARRTVNPTLYFQYFSKTVGQVTEITTAEQAADAITSLLATVRTGGTNIQAAILRSIEQIRDAQRRGVDLARANIVLITDGEAPVDEDEIVTQLRSLGELRTGINIIALGVENPSLRNLAAHQKAMGRRTFYQFIDEATIGRIIDGRRDGVCLHPPTDVELAGCAELLKETIDSIEALERPSASETGSDAFLEQALEEMDEDTALRAALRGRIEVANRDHAALARRFKRWFPEPAGTQSEVVYCPDQGTEARLFQAVSLLEAVVEVSSLMTADAPSLQADALEIFQRSLYDSGISPLEYTRLQKRFPERFREATLQLYRVVGMGPTPSG